MVIRFAHTSDIHLGFQRDPALQDVEMETFRSMMDSFIERKVDFVLMPGDIFHTNVPRMQVQKAAFEAFRRVHDAGIPIYVVYGSHDFSPVSASVIDLLASTGYVTKAMLLHDDGEAARLDFVQDPKTGAKIAGLYGLKQGKDSNWYDRLDLGSLEAEDGFKVFMFHGAISEMNEDEEGEKIPLERFPKGFNYYAGGHMHKNQHYAQEEYSHVVYPGTPFAGFHQDMEDTARGKIRGYYVIEWNGTAQDGGDGCSLEFVELPSPPHQLIEVGGDGLDPDAVTAKALACLDSLDSAGMIMIIKMHGQMKSGKASSVDSAAISRAAAGAISCVIKTSGLKSMEYDVVESVGESREDIIKNVFAENIPQFKGEKALEGEAGLQTAVTLLQALEKPKIEGQTKSDYDDVIVEEARAALELP